MHRYIYNFYDTTQKPQINKLTSLFKQVIEKKNEEDTKNSIDLLDGNSKTMFGDLIIEYCIDIKSIGKKDFEGKRAFDILKTYHLIPSSSFITYLETKHTDWLAYQLYKSQEEFKSSILKYRDEYDRDSDYPIYVRSLGAKEKYEKLKSVYESSFLNVQLILKEYGKEINVDRYVDIRDGKIHIEFNDDE